MRGGLRRVFLLGVAALPLQAPPHLTAQVGRQEVVEVSFTGNQAFSDTELQRAIFTEASSCPLILALTTCAIGLDWGRDRFFYSPRVLSDDLERLRLLYLAHGFREATVDTTLVRVRDDALSVRFRIAEGAPFRVGSVNFAGDPVPATLRLGEGLPLSAGDPLSFLLLQETADTLTARLRDSGFASAEVFRRYRRVAPNDTATVTYDIELGPPTTIGAIRIVGNAQLDDDVIIGRLPFREGQPFRERQIREAQRSLYELDIVARALVERDSANIEVDSVMPIRVSVAEGDAHRVRTGGGLNTADCLNFEGRWASRNFFGGGRILQTRARVSNLLASPLHSTPLCSEAGTDEFGQTNWLVGLDFTQPTFFSPQTSFFAGLFAERQSLKNIFVRDAFGLDFGLSRNVGRGAFFNLRFQPQLNRLNAAEVTLCATFLACAPADIEVLSGTTWLSPVAFSFTQDRTDDLFNPRTGFRGLVDLEVADGLTGSDYAYFRAFVDGSLYREVDRRTILALRFRGGRISPGAFEGPTLLAGDELEIVPPQRRFYAGGANSIRGFAQSTLGPRSLSIGVQQLLRRRGSTASPTCEPMEVRTLSCDGSPLSEADLFQVRPIGGLGTLAASAELRFDLSENGLGGAAFVDVGQVWPEGLAMDNLEVTPGLGVRYNTLFGPIRLDVAYSFRDREPLQVVTSQIRPFIPGVDADGDRIDIAPVGASPELIDWVISEDLALLQPKVLFGDDPGFSLRRFQIHFSIGQAF